MRPRLLVRTTVLVLSAALAACASTAADGARSASPGHAVANADAATDHHAHPAPLGADTPLPGASVWHLDDLWTDHRGDAVRLGDHRGHEAVVVLFYGTCISACPVLLHDAELIEDALPDAVRATTHFLMVSFDPERDTPERLAAYAAEKGLDRERWSFLTADDRAVRRLAAALGVRYRSDGQGGFAHTNLITVLDGDGVPIARLEGLGLGPAAAVTALAATP